MKQSQQYNHQIRAIFPNPVYSVTRNYFQETEKEETLEIADIIKEGMYDNFSNSTTNNNYIFDTKLKKLKQFCESHLNTYVKEIINPKKELDFYITQSWINITKPGETHHDHSHPNSIISGVFYISTEETDTIHFGNPNNKVRELIQFEREEYTIWNSNSWYFNVNNNELLLFPSWLNHQVEANEKATADRISLSFNTFVRGNLGSDNELTELRL